MVDGDDDGGGGDDDGDGCEDGGGGEGGWNGCYEGGGGAGDSGGVNGCDVGVSVGVVGYGGVHIVGMLHICSGYFTSLE